MNVMTASSWIPVADRLPEIPARGYSKPVAVIDDLYPNVACYYNPNGCSQPFWLSAESGGKLTRVTHWMPLPHTPEGMGVRP